MRKLEGRVVEIRGRKSKSFLPREDAARAARHAFDLVLAEADQHARDNANLRKTVKSIERFAAGLTDALSEETGVPDLVRAKVAKSRIEARDCLFAIEQLCIQLSGNLGHCTFLQAPLEALDIALRPLIPDLNVEIPWERLDEETRTRLVSVAARNLEDEGWTFDNAPAIPDPTQTR